MSAFHPDLEASQRWLPRGVGRRWALPLLRGMMTLARWSDRDRECAELGPASVFVYRPAETPPTPAPAMLWIHGGGMIIGHARQQGPLLQSMAEELGCIIASVEYRLAPEHPFPAPLDDCEAGWRWLLAQDDIDPARIAIAGQSAGGGLAAALCQRLRDAGGPQPCFQLLIYPMLDDRSSAGSGPSDEHFRAWDRQSNQLGWDSLLRGHDRDAPPPHAVPGRTEDLSGLPPAWIGVGTLDLFHDEDVAYAERLRAGGVEVALDIVAGAYHGFDAADAKAEVSRKFRADRMRVLRRYLLRDPSSD